MLDGDPTNSNTNQASDLIKESSMATFATDVVVPSKECPVIVDFWAPNCAPCAELTPALERLVRAANGAVKLVKINLQENQQLAAQLQIQSVPTVYIFKDGRPIDGFTGALPESELKKLIDALAGGAGNDPLAELIGHANNLLEQGDAQTAAEIFAQILTKEPENAESIAGLIKCYISVNELESAEQTLKTIPEKLRDDPAIVAAKSQLQLALKSQDTGEVSELREKLDADPGNHQLRFDLAIALNAANDRDGAADQLIEILKLNKSWNEGAAQSQLLELFEIWGAADEHTIRARKKLSSLLFS